MLTPSSLDWEPKTPSQHAWYSNEFAKNKGYAIYRGLDGVEIKVTHLSTDPLYYVDILVDKSYDIQYCGCVRELIRKVTAKPPPPAGGIA